MSMTRRGFFGMLAAIPAAAAGAAAASIRRSLGPRERLPSLISPTQISREVLAALERNTVFARNVNRDFEEQWTALQPNGRDATKARMPLRFRSQG